MTLTMQKTFTRGARGYCPYCARSQKLRMDGTLCRHGNCPGEGETPTQVISYGSVPVYAAPPKKKEAKKRKTSLGATHVAIVIDASGSMSTKTRRAMKAANAMLAPMKKEKNYRVSFWTFGNTAQCEIADRDARHLTLPNDYGVRGMTALRDATLEAADSLWNVGRHDPDAAFLVIVVTDGHENNSSCSVRQFEKKIKAYQSTDRWTFAFSVPDRAGQRSLLQSHVPAGNIQLWSGTREGLEDVGRAGGQAVTRYTSARRSGAKKSTSFYETINVGRVALNEVKRQLTETPKRNFRKITAKRQTTIQECVEEKGIVYSPGAAFYELTKPERIQAHKEVILEDRNSGQLYAGFDEVRAVLNIHKGEDGRIKPGNLGEWIVWVQSTSTNRKLLAKTQILYRN